MRITCTPTISPDMSAGSTQFLLYALPNDPEIGTAGNRIVETVARQGMLPAQRAWDFLSIALAVCVADQGALRQESSDGWTRQMDLDIAVSEPVFWNSLTDQIESTLGFLTNDIWSLRFSPGGVHPGSPRRKKPQMQDSVCLLSGGMDSLIGALDLAADGHNLMMVSQVSHGDKPRQQQFAAAVPGRKAHLQLNHNVRLPAAYAGMPELSYRARSVIFLAYGVLAATALDQYQDGAVVDLFVPENGFISINIPLTPLRIGSLSTRTTHPFFMASIQRLLDAAGLRVRIVTPYKFKTKGEMLVGCRDQAILRNHAFSATSCGRFIRKHMHCGRCVPCLVRRAAIHRWDVADATRYRFGPLSQDDTDHRRFDDVRSVATAIEEVRLYGFDRWAGAALNSVQLGDTAPYRVVAERGLEELRVFLAAEGVL